MKYKTIEEIKNSDLPDRIEFAEEYFPEGVGPGSFDPQMLYMFALASNAGRINECVTKSWVILWLLDHVDWQKVSKEFNVQKTDLEEAAEEVIPMSAEHIGPGKFGTFAAKMIQPEDDPRYESGTALGRDAGWY